MHIEVLQPIRRETLTGKPPLPAARVWTAKPSGGSRLRKFAILMLFLTGFSAIAQPSWAGNQQGTISQITYSTGGIAYFTLSGSPASMAGCATAQRWAIVVTAPAGQAALAILLSAQAQGKTINIAGTGACDVWPDSETIGFFYFN